MSLGWRWAPRRASRLDVDMRPTRIEFGDGYEQVTPLSDLPTLRQWDLVFENNVADVRQMEEFLIARAGAQAFEFEDPDSGLPVTVRCERFNKEPFTAVRHRLSARFMEVRV